MAAAAGMDKKTKIQLALMILLVIMASVVFFFMLWSPKHTEIKGKRDNLTKLNNDLALKRGLAANKVRLEKEIVQLEAKFKEAVKSLPDDKEIPRLISQINENMSKSGLDFMLFRPAASRPKDFYSEYPIDIRVQGGYHSVGIFLDHISKMERIVNVGDIRLASVGAPGQPPLPQGVKLKPGTSLTADFRISTYTYSGEKEKAAKEKEKKAPTEKKG